MDSKQYLCFKKKKNSINTLPKPSFYDSCRTESMTKSGRTDMTKDQGTQV